MIILDFFCQFVNEVDIVKYSVLIEGIWREVFIEVICGQVGDYFWWWYYVDLDVFVGVEFGFCNIVVKQEVVYGVFEWNVEGEIFLFCWVLFVEVFVCQSDCLVVDVFDCGYCLGN